MNPPGPAPALWSEHYSQAKQGREDAASAATPQHVTVYTLIVAVDLTGSLGSEQHLRYLGRVKSDFSMIWINKHKHAET